MAESVATTSVREVNPAQDKGASLAEHGSMILHQIGESLLGLIDGDRRTYAGYEKIVLDIKSYEGELGRLSDLDLRRKTKEFRDRIDLVLSAESEALERTGATPEQKKEHLDKALDDVLEKILPEAYAVVKEAIARRLKTMDPDTGESKPLVLHDEQLIGGIVMFKGGVAEMLTGEGKTLAATLPLYLRALAKRGAHLVTTNDYLAEVGAISMGPIFDSLGMTVGFIQEPEEDSPGEGKSFRYTSYAKLPHLRENPDDTGCAQVDRDVVYAYDITYVNAKELAFDYLNDNLVLDPDGLVLRPFYFAIVDEADSILIDDATDPLVISHPRETTEEEAVLCDYMNIYRLIESLRGTDAETCDPSAHYTVHQKERAVVLEDEGIMELQRALKIRDLTLNPRLFRTINACLRAHVLYHDEKQYIVQNDEIVIIDPFTGFPSFGRRYQNGIHQALEAKHGLTVHPERQVVASTTFQNFFRLYDRLAGMTGTAKSEEAEFKDIYRMFVTEIPPHEEVKRRDLPDTFFRTKEQKFRGIVSDVLLRHATGQPVLIATTTIAESEELHSRLQKENIQALIMIDLLKRDAADSNDPVWTASLYQQLKRPLKDISIVKLEAVMASRGLDPCPWSRANLAHFASLHRFVIDESMLTHLESAVRNGIEAPVLNARQYRRAGEIIKCAGKPYAGTVATNMAGRGVDIMLGGYECTVEDAELARRSGGLYVLGTERQTCRRMDNQLKGRSGRQGDPGESRFYVSLEDELLQPFIELLNGTERLKRSGPIASLVDRLSGTANNILDDCDSMVDPLLSRSVENLQKIIQGKTFERRKISLKFDDVLNIHRRFIYGDRRAILKGQDLRPTITGYLHSTIDTMLDSSHTSLVEFPAETDPENASALHVLRDEFDSFFPVSDYLSDEDWDLDRHDLSRKLHEAIDQAYEGNAPDPERIEYLHQRIESLMAESEMTPEGQRNDHDACWIVEHTYLERLYKKLGSIFDISRHVSLADLNAMGSEEWAPALHQAVDAAYSEREQEIIDSGKSPRLVEQHEALKIINEAWAEHLLRFEELRERAELRAFAKDPNLWFVFHREAFDCFNALKETIVDTLARRMFEPGVLEHGT